MDTSILGLPDNLAADVSGTRPLVPGMGVGSELEPGELIQGKYCVRDVLGRGGFAVVYDAEHVGLGRAVALKVLHIGPETPLSLIERFRREARISALVNHPNVLEVYDTGQLADGSPFLVMERVNGENLSALIRRGPLSIAMTVEIGRQLLLGLSAISEAGIVHRDIKPDNIMVHDAGDGMPLVKLVDFGISKHVSIEPQARLTCQGALIGTPQYMSPEQIRGEDVDVRTDIYAVGAVLYEALAGRAPHESQSFSELVVAILNSRVQPLSELRLNCPKELECIISSALERARSRRYSSARDFLAALEEFVCMLDLPSGADAFRARDDEALLAVSAPRRSTAGSSGFFGRQPTRKRALQVAMIALALCAPAARSLRTQPASQLEASVPVGSAIQRSSAGQATQVLSAVMGIPTGREAPLALPPDDTFRTPPRPDVSPVGHEAALAEAVLAEAAPSEAVPSEAVPSEVAPSEPVPAEAAVPVRGRAHGDSQARAQTTPAATPSAATAQPDLLPTQADAALEGQLVPERAAQGGQPAELTAEQRASWEQAMQLALASLVRGQLAGAKRGYESAIRIAPREPAGFRGLGLVAARLGESREARTALRRYLSLAPKAPDGALIAARIASLKE